MFSHFGVAVCGIGISNIRKGFPDLGDDSCLDDSKIPVVLSGKLQGFNLDGADTDLMGVIKQSRIFDTLISLYLDDPTLIQLGSFLLKEASIFNLTQGHAVNH